MKEKIVLSFYIKPLNIKGLNLKFFLNVNNSLLQEKAV